MTDGTTTHPNRLGTRLRAVVAAAAVAGLAITAGTGFMLQSNIDAKKQALAATAELRDAAELEQSQLAVGRDILLARAGGAADTAIDAASSALSAADGKVDASALASTVAQLDGAAMLDPGRVYELVATANAQAGELAAAVAEFDRVEAERRAAEEAARLAAERAAAERAAQEAAAARTSNGGSNGGGGGAPAAPSNPSAAQQIAREMSAQRYGWGDDQFGCLVAVWNYESGWNASASNRSSGAYGIPQALPGSKMASHGADWQTNPATQISWGIDYIAGRYSNPCGAWAHIQSTGWY